jgi:uncharacterized membrane protein
MCLGAVMLFLITVGIDRAAARGTLALPRWISIGGIDDARAILGALLGAVSTVLALIFSVALLVLSMAVSNFGPRILYRFVRDAMTQVTIGLFLASFVHILLDFVVTRRDIGERFVPQLSIVCDVVLVMLSFVILVVFSHRIAMSIQTQNVVAHIVADLDAALADMRTLFRQLGLRSRTPAADAERDALLARGTREGAPVRAAHTGFVQEIDVLRLREAVDRPGDLLILLFRPGQFVFEGTPVARVLPAERVAALAPAILRDVKIGTHRTLKQDLEFGIAQLVEIALRALSPAVNDTFTGLTCVDWLGDELRAFALIPEGTGICEIAQGEAMIVWPPLRIARLVKTAFDQIRQASVGNAAVTIRLLQTFARLGEHADNVQFREALAEQVDAVWEATSVESLVKTDRADVEAAYRRAREALGLR